MGTKHLFRPGDRMLVQAHEILGTPESMATVIELKPYGYLVVCDDDPEKWPGPVDYCGRVLVYAP